MADNQNEIKYNLILEFVNKILSFNNCPNITNLLDFKDVPRETMISDECLKFTEEMENDVFKYFDKNKSGYVNKKRSIKTYPLNFLRGLLRQINYELINRTDERSEKINGRGYRRKWIFYSIKQNE